MISWRTSSHSDKRQLAMSGRAEVGAVFPPISDGKWMWRLWVNGQIANDGGQTDSELAAKNALETAWGEFLRRAGLAEAA